MIFIGPKLSQPDAHFVTNVIDAIGTQHDLVIDLFLEQDDETIFGLIHRHTSRYGSEPVIYNPYQNEGFFRRFREQFPNLRLFMFFSDDEWRHHRFDRVLALYADLFSIAAKSNLSEYRRYGLSSVAHIPWACNPDRFKPVKTSVQYDVTFIGAAYGPRVDYVRYLVARGVRVRIFGRGWDRVRSLRRVWGGSVSHEEALSIISGSKINLSFLWTSQDETRAVIKGRTLELAACQAFQITNESADLENYGLRPGKHLVTFTDRQDLLSKVERYLSRPDDRKEMAQRAFEIVTANHTWQKRFEGLRRTLLSTSRPRLPTLTVLLVSSECDQPGRRELNGNLIVSRCEPGSATLRQFEHVDAVFELKNTDNIDFEMLYAMTFFRRTDDNDVVVSAFYLPWSGDRLWIRLKSANIIRRPWVRRQLPFEVVGYSMCFYLSKTRVGNAYAARIPTVIEYPFIEVRQVGRGQARLLRALWGQYAKPARLKRFLRSGRLVQVLGVILDAVIQRAVG